MSRDAFAPDAARTLIAASIEESIEVKRAVLGGLLDEIATAGAWIGEALAAGGKVVLFGNGGSAADAQHLAAELVGRFERERRALPAIALTTDTSILTALANDYGVEAMFARQVEAVGAPGDVAIGLSTSGASPNVVAGVHAARERGMRAIGLTGGDGGALAAACDLAIRIPSSRTARIQEGHATVAHALCEVVEATVAGELGEPPVDAPNEPVLGQRTGWPDRIELVVFDFDGVMTDNRLTVTDSGEEGVVCHRGDGWGIACMRAAEVPMMILSTEPNPVVGARAEKLKIPCHQDVPDKATHLRELLDERGIDPGNVAFVGNDANDLECLALVGLPVVVADAEPVVMGAAKLVLSRRGGHGAVRELCDLVLRHVGRSDARPR